MQLYLKAILRNKGAGDYSTTLRHIRICGRFEVKGGNVGQTKGAGKGEVEGDTAKLRAEVNPGPAGISLQLSYILATVVQIQSSQREDLTT